METEIKLSPVAPAQVQALLTDPAVAPFLGAEQAVQMHTIYYDDPADNLAQGHCTLRLRRENQRSVCTFKAPAEGKFSRLEVEAEADTIEAGVQALLRTGALPFFAAALLSRMQVVPTCGARFVRQAWRFSRGDFSCILSYDSGVLYAGTDTAPIREMEAELEAGTPALLTEFFLPLAERYALPLCHTSKHARALKLRALK